MPITNFSKPSSKQMVMMSGISSYGLWLLQGTCQRTTPYQSRTYTNRASWPIQQGRKDTPFVYPEELEHGGCEMAQRNRTYFRLHLSESVWTAHYYSWNSFSTQTFCWKIRDEQRGGLPHSFRHRFAKNFLDRFNDLALLADLMGHESIETTRIYLRRTASEQQKIVDKVVNW